MLKRTSLAQLVADFLPLCESRPVRNEFERVPEVRHRRDVYKYVTETLDGSHLLDKMKLVTFECGAQDYKDGQNEISCGMFPSDYEPRKKTWVMNWATVELVVEYLDGQDPFDDPAGEQTVLDAFAPSVGQIFKYQQRQFVFAVVLISNYARVARFDRAGIFVSERIDYNIDEDGVALTEFFLRYARLNRVHRGHDPTAVRIHHGDPLFSRLMRYGNAFVSAGSATSDCNDQAHPTTTSAPLEHVLKFFNESLDLEWPWWKLAVPGKEDNLRWFAVGKPHFYTGCIKGRGTRGYVAVPLDSSGTEIDSTQYSFVYLKDTWRFSCDGMEREGDVLSALNAKNVLCVPSLVCHGDLSGQTTGSDTCCKEIYGARDSYQHYRLVVKEIGKPLSEFQNGYQLVFAVFCCIVAHKAACLNAGYIHGDVSAGNILLYPDENGIWSGLLNDWEMSRRWKDGKTQVGARQLGRMGTWQFMSVRTLLDPKATVELTDDLESFFHVLVYYAVRFLPHNISDAFVGQFLRGFFDGCAKGARGLVCSSQKTMTLNQGFFNVSGMVEKEHGFLRLTFYSSITGQKCSDSRTTRERHIIDELICELLQSFQAFYHKNSNLRPQEPQTTQSAPRHEKTPMEKALLARFGHLLKGERKPITPAWTVDYSLATIVESHNQILSLFWRYVIDESSMWPADDRGEDKKPKSSEVDTAESTTASVLRRFAGLRRR